MEYRWAKPLFFAELVGEWGALGGAVARRHGC